MAIVQEQWDFVQGSLDPGQVTLPGVAAGSLLICCVSAFDGATPRTATISDNQGNTWTDIYQTNYDGDDYAVLAYAMNANAGSTTIDIDPDSGSTAWMTAVCIEVSGIKTSAALDQQNETTNTASTWDSGNITTTEPNEYLIGVFAHDDSNQTLTEDTPWTLIFKEETQVEDMPISVSERIVSSTLTESYSGDNSASLTWWAGIASFEAEPTATGLPERIQPRGVARGVVRGSI